MNPRLERIDGPSPNAKWFIVAYAAWAALIVGVHLVNQLTDREFIICTLRRVTDVPCPTCGSTRAVNAALRGDLLAALSYNPLVMVLLAAGAAVLVLRFAFKRRVVLCLTKRGRAAAWALAVVAVGLNWWHVISYHAA